MIQSPSTSRLLNPAVYNQAIEMAKDLVSCSNAVFFDTETTGFGMDAEIVEITALDNEGKTMLDTLVKPLKPIPPEVSQITHITNEMVAFAPSLQSLKNALEFTFSRKVWVAYNASFDVRMFYQSHQISGIRFAPNFFAVYDAMLIVSNILQMPNPYGGFKWVKLGEAAKLLQVDLGDADLHRAKADTTLMLQILYKISKLERVE
ncbi:3'-5' exonuclease [Ornatilinea apprima]|nr:3'-5' exonuclease [Ornatilinea apprima]